MLYLWGRTGRGGGELIGGELAKVGANLLYLWGKLVVVGRTCNGAKPLVTIDPLNNIHSLQVASQVIRLESIEEANHSQSLAHHQDLVDVILFKNIIVIQYFLTSHGYFFFLHQVLLNRHQSDSKWFEPGSNSQS